MTQDKNEVAKRQRFLPFKVMPYDACDKSIVIAGPGTLSLQVDYDDVDHEEVNWQVKRLLRILNRNW